MIQFNELQTIINQQKIITLHQPIICIKSKKIIGLEALSRGIDPISGKIILPIPLFQAAKMHNLTLELDRTCRAIAIKQFSESKIKENLILFVNFDPTILSQVSIGNCWMQQITNKYKLNNNSIAIEIVESHVPNPKDIIDFVNLYRSFGFLIVLDDFGSQQSNLDRILMVKPDIIKIDRGLVHGSHKDYYKQAIISSIVGLSDKIGCMCLAEGVEDIEDIIKCHELGISLFQGYFFAKPNDMLENQHAICSDTIKSVSQILMDHLDSHLAEQMAFQRTFYEITHDICQILYDIPTDQFDEFLSAYVNSHHEIECCYVIDENGKQTCNTLCSQNVYLNRRHSLFNPSIKGEDHSLKAYYYNMKILKLDQYLTEAYISLATGNLCRTMSESFHHIESNKRLILCVDFLVKSDRIKN